MPRVNIVGIGTGDLKSITREAEETIRNSHGLIGDKRVLKPFEHLNKTVFYSSNVTEIKEYLSGWGEEDSVSVLVSGDVGFYSLAKGLTAAIDPKEKVRLVCGISSLQYFCAKCRVPWENVNVLSLHGRKGKVVNRVINNQIVFVMTGGKYTPSDVCRELCQAGLGFIQVSVGENLSYPQERITAGTAELLADKTFEDLSVMLIFQDQLRKRDFVTHGLPDEMFIRGDVPMTKQEIRAVVLSKLQLTLTDTVYDIGAGTGSVAVEMALQVTEGSVYGIEKNPEAVDILRKNKEKFAAYNLNIIQEEAPEGLADLPCPDKVFIGGSGGRLKDILEVVYARNDQARVVISAITLETLNEAVSYYQNKTDQSVEIVHIAVTKTRKIGGYNLLTGQNPVFVLTSERVSPGTQGEGENSYES